MSPTRLPQVSDTDIQNAFYSRTPTRGATTAGSFDPKTTYEVNFKVYYKTKHGESLCVLGSTPELGSWKEYRCHMKWTEGHIWVLEKPLITNHYYFQYKYILLDGDKTKFMNWERGIDRIADLEIMPSVNELQTAAYYGIKTTSNNY